jgi:hypothetical protein
MKKPGNLKTHEPVFIPDERSLSDSPIKRPQVQ